MRGAWRGRWRMIWRKRRTSSEGFLTGGRRPNRPVAFLTLAASCKTRLLVWARNSPTDTPRRNLGKQLEQTLGIDRRVRRRPVIVSSDRVKTIVPRIGGVPAVYG